MLRYFCTTLILGITIISFGQKNKVDVYNLDQINGLFYQRNTIGPFSGMAVEDHPNGKKKMRVPIKDGMFEGTTQEWAKDGTKILEVEYKKGKKQGKEIQWYATGQKRLELTNVLGLPDGMVVEWHKNGQKKSEGLFKEGFEDGLHQWWFSNGQLDQVATYIYGKSDGVVKNWDQSGQLVLESNYKKGLKQGSTTKWHSNGQKKAFENYAEGQTDGEFKYWNDEGFLHTIRIYKMGKLIQEKNYRSGSINIGNGYMQVYNEPKSYFQVKVTGDRVRPVDMKTITYIVNGQLVQLFNIPTERFIDNVNESQKGRAIMDQYIDYETLVLKNKEPNFNFEIKQDPFVTTNDIEAIHWHFDSPSKYVEGQTSRTVQEEHYVSLMCGGQVLSIYSAVTKADNAEEVEQLLRRIAEEVWVADAPIDLNGIIANLRK